jgi:hypothetical protein
MKILLNFLKKLLGKTFWFLKNINKHENLLAQKNILKKLAGKLFSDFYEQLF